MQGFWNNPQATAERMVDGWVKTGDIGRLDANGYLFRLDRADGRRGRGIRHPRSEWARRRVLWCVKREAAVTEKELVELSSVHLCNYKRPGKVVLRHDPLPKTPVGKIKRKELREPFWVGRERRVAGN
jgi:acyl-CoA synthetase (AMP-forming)/AMP-acid ligase II